MSLSGLSVLFEWGNKVQKKTAKFLGLLFLSVILLGFISAANLGRTQKQRNLRMCDYLQAENMLAGDSICVEESMYETFSVLFREGMVDVRFVRVAMQDYDLLEGGDGKCTTGEPGIILNYGIGKEALWGGYGATIEFIFCDDSLVRYIWYD